MTINKAIKLLEKLAEKYSPNGDSIEVYFDCPECNKAFTPTRLDAEVKYEIRVVIPAASK